MFQYARPKILVHKQKGNCQIALPVPLLRQVDGPFSEGFSEGTFGRVFGRFPTDLDPILGHFGFTSDHFWDHFGNIFSTIVIALIFIDFGPNLDALIVFKKGF